MSITQLTPDNITLFMMFVIPGLISLKIYDLVVPGQRRDFSKSLFEIIAYSIMNLTIFIIPMAIMKSFEIHEVLNSIAMYIIIFIAPIFWPLLFIKLSNVAFFSKRIISLNPTAWDSVFSKKKSAWIKLHLKTGHCIGGLYDINSYTSSYPYPNQIFLEKAWEIEEKDGKYVFGNPIEKSKGILIFGSEILAIEFFDYERSYENNDSAKKE